MKFGIQQLIATSLASMIYHGSVQAVPLYYTFEGTISPYNYIDPNPYNLDSGLPVAGNSGILEQIGLFPGDAMSLTVMIDNGNPDEGPVVPEYGTVVRNMAYQAEFVESSVFDLVHSFYPDRSVEPASVSAGPQFVYRDGVLMNDGYSDLHLSVSSDLIGHHSLYIYDAVVSDWEVGSTVSQDNRTVLHGMQPGEISTFNSRLVLTEISAEYPTTGEDGTPYHSVPEPSTFLLTSLGLLGIGARRYFKTA
jgi:hypothetical protein